MAGKLLRVLRKQRAKCAALVLVTVAAFLVMHMAHVPLALQVVHTFQLGVASAFGLPAPTSVFAALLGLVSAAAVHGLGRVEKLHGTQQGFVRECMTALCSVAFAILWLDLNLCVPNFPAFLPNLIMPLGVLVLVGLSVAARVVCLRVDLPKTRMERLRAELAQHRQAEADQIKKILDELRQSSADSPLPKADAAGTRGKVSPAQQPREGADALRATVEETDADQHGETMAAGAKT